MSQAEAIAPADRDVLLTVEGVTKHFAGVTALSDVSLDVRRGEILGLLGENGAGKSTLLKILSGVMPPSSGRIVFDGAEFSPANPQDASRRGNPSDRTLSGASNPQDMRAFEHGTPQIITPERK